MEFPLSTNPGPHVEIPSGVQIVCLNIFLGGTEGEASFLNEELFAGDLISSRDRMMELGQGVLGNINCPRVLARQ